VLQQRPFTRRSVRRSILVSTLVMLTAAAGVAALQLPTAGAAGLLHPARHRAGVPAPTTCEDATFPAEGIHLHGWRCRATAARRATIVYLHGIADNRTSGVGVIQRFLPRGFDVVAYDSRAHGESDGDSCTYGFFEKKDLHRVIDAVGDGPVVLLGTSLGAAVAILEAADDQRVATVVAVETFADLRSIAVERAPFFFTASTIRKALQLAEEQGRFDIHGVSPERAAARITVPVLLVHGAADVDTRPEHSQRVFGALHGPKRLIIVPGATHNASLRPDVWQDVENWIDQVVPQLR
jgi:pimeloyl-ACP methyl ester carboxylesterase